MQNINYIILRYLEEFLKKYSKSYEYVFSDNDVVEITAIPKNNKSNRIIILRFGTNHNNKQIYISNIFVPFDLRYNGIGKKLILLIHTIAQSGGYDVFVVQLVDGFKEKLLRRGAVWIDEDTVLISHSTNLL